MESSRVKRRRLLMVPCPYQGHINPMLHLATFLHQNGFSITIAHTFFNSPHPYRHPEFTFLPLNDSITADHVSSWDLASVLLAINENCKGSLEEAMAAMAGGDGEESSEVVCIIHDELMYYCEGVASRFGVRSLVLRTTSAATCVSRCAVLNLHAAGFEEEIPAELHPLRLKDLPLPATSDFTKFHELVINMYTITTAKAVIWNTMPWLEPSELNQIKAKFCQIPIFPIAPIHKISPTSSSSSLLKEDSTCLSWLDKQPPKSVIYVSLGSVALLTKEEVEEMGWGLVNSNQPFLWVVRPGSVRGSDAIELVLKEVEEKVGDRGCIVQWAPQKEVLGHGGVGGFWSHCGWNSTLESLSEGVPLLCRAFSGDQRVNARYISCVWGVGLTLEGELDRKEVEKVIRRVMVEEEGRKMKERAMDFKRRIEDSLKEDRSSSCDLKDR
ncbi:LOW QUALITY PROTEIN: UDP-glucose iridoid glucosyltransferase-like [Cucurbita maxima]|uniref:LOW QUALITY PROTEIN: UDP-glucose iridoid glucosyltransferase-like n=1 Tax=Cucurbita maxima TaxID=3661 RepID=A0A6J1KHD9_CUCMA|nr:LOW QUALITY PROTEIN: UDP-glucose iridoid glucosyltransferase-like [Cucurbita maxima]